MPRVSDEGIQNVIEKLGRPSRGKLKIFEIESVLSLCLALQDARAALRKIANWKERPEGEAPLTYIERIAKEVGG